MSPMNAVSGEPPQKRCVALLHQLGCRKKQNAMHEIIYLIGLVVVVMFILGALGIR